jgi:arylsulfatase A
MKRFLIFLIMMCLTCSVSAEDSKPNIVFILADDLGYGDTKTYGGDRCQIETPHIDALAKGGLKFTDAHVNASVCGPTRAAIMTGRYPWRYGKSLPGGPWGFVGARYPADTYTLGDLFKSVDYQTGYIGKWHLGTQMTTKDGKVQNIKNVDFTKPLMIGPKNYGFDYSFILPGSLDMYPYAFARNNIWQGEVTAQKGWSAFHRVGPAEKDFEDHQVLETFYSEAEAFISKQKQDAPFFLFLALTAPHTPTSPGEKFKGKSSLGVYGDFVMEVDHSVERVMSALKKQGLDENTLVLFSTDHGAASYAGNILKATPGQIHLLEEKGHYANANLRGFKFTVYEGGLRVPLIAHWPKVIKPGSVCDELVGTNDLMATFAELTGAKIDPENAPDSISFANLLTSPESEGTRKNLIMQGVGPFVVREGDWKLCLCPGSGAPVHHEIVPTPDAAWKTALKELGREPTWDDLKKFPFVQLFNLKQDISEKKNIAAQHPEKVAALIQILQTQMQDGRSTPGPKLEGRQPHINQRIPKFVNVLKSEK